VDVIQKDAHIDSAMNTTTLELFLASRSGLSGQPGRIPTRLILESLDTLWCIHAVCSRVHVELGLPSPATRYARAFEYLRKSSEMTIPQIQRVLVMWKKWTWNFHDTVPSGIAIESFLSELHTGL